MSNFHNAFEYNDEILFKRLTAEYNAAASNSLNRIVYLAEAIRRGYSRAEAADKIKIALQALAAGKSLFYREYNTAAAAVNAAGTKKIDAEFLTRRHINAAAYVKASAAGKRAEVDYNKIITAAEVIKTADSEAAGKMVKTAADMKTAALNAAARCDKKTAEAAAEGLKTLAAEAAEAAGKISKSTRVDNAAEAAEVSDKAAEVSDKAADKIDLSKVPTSALVDELTRRGVVIDAATLAAAE